MTKEDEFECREKFLIRGFFWSFWTIRTLMQRTKLTVFHLNTPLQVLFSEWVHDGEFRTCSGWGIQVWRRSKLKKAEHLGNFGLPRQGCKEHESTILSSKTPLHLEYFSMPTPIEEIKPVVLVKNEFQNRKKIKTKMFSSEVPDYLNTDTGEKNRCFFS